jgi:hypothetical protein
MLKKWNLEYGAPEKIVVKRREKGRGCHKKVFYSDHRGVLVGSFLNRDHEDSYYFLLKDIRGLVEKHPEIEFPRHVPFSRLKEKRTYIAIEDYGVTLEETISIYKNLDFITKKHILQLIRTIVLSINESGISWDNFLDNLSFDEEKGLRNIDPDFHPRLNILKVIETIGKDQSSKKIMFLGINMEIINQISKNPQINFLCQLKPCLLSNSEKQSLIEFFTSLAK